MDGPETIDVSPREYLDMAAGRMPLPGAIIVVDGSLDLTRHPLKKEIKLLPAAIINGDLVLDKSCAVETVHCTVRDSLLLTESNVREIVFKLPALTPTAALVAKDCRNLKNVQGWFTSARLTGSGVENLGGGLVCEMSLFVDNCKNLYMLDCRANSICAVGSSVCQLGVNLETRDIILDDCKNLKVVGHVKGLLSASFSSSGVEIVTSAFSCTSIATFENCRKLRSLSGIYGTINVSEAPLQVADMIAATEARFIGCDIPDTMAKTAIGNLTFESCDLRKLPKGISPSTTLNIFTCHDFTEMPRRWDSRLLLSGLNNLRGIEGFECGGLEVRECVSMEKITGKINGNLLIGEGNTSLLKLGQDLRVAGDLTVEPENSLKELDCDVSGGVMASGSGIEKTGPNFRCRKTATFKQCKKLFSLKGFVGGDAVLESSEARTLGADFECGGDLLAAGTLNLETLNCTVGGKVDLFGSGLIKTGPAFHCGKDFRLAQASGRASDLRGAVMGFVTLDDETRERLVKNGRLRFSRNLAPTPRQNENPTPSKLAKPTDSHTKIPSATVVTNTVFARRH